MILAKLGSNKHPISLHHIVITSSSVHYSHLIVSPAGTGYVGVKHKALEMIVLKNYFVLTCKETVITVNPAGTTSSTYITDIGI